MMISHLTPAPVEVLDYFPETVDIQIKAEQVQNHLYRFTDTTELKNPSDRSWTVGANVVGTGMTYETAGESLDFRRIRYTITRVIKTAGSTYSRTFIWQRTRSLRTKKISWSFSLLVATPLNQIDPSTIPDGDTTSPDPGAEIIP